MSFNVVFGIYGVALLVLSSRMKKNSRVVIFLGDSICVAIVITILVWAIGTSVP